MVVAHAPDGALYVLLIGLFPESRLRRSKAGNRHAEGRAGHIVEPDLVTEFDGVRVSSVLAANTQFDVLAGLAAPLNTDVHELPDALDIE